MASVFKRINPRIILFSWVVIYPCLGWAGTGHIRGQVKDAQSNAPVRRVTISAYAMGHSRAAQTISANDGSYDIADLAAGEYVVCLVGVKGYRSFYAGPVKITD